MMLRREMLLAGMAAAAAPKAKLTGIELIPARATERTVWLMVRLRSDAGVDGWGEASDAFGFGNTTAADARRMRAELERHFAGMRGWSPFDVARFRQTAKPEGLLGRTAVSAMEQAMWDMAGKLLDVPVYTLFGGAVRKDLPVYANINRATKVRTPEGFAASAKRAVAEGFRSVKLAPFDGFPKEPGAVAAFVDGGIACLFAVREAVGPDVEVMVDCHSFFDVKLAIAVAKRLEPVRLAWYEEPVAPERTEATREIRSAIRQEMAGGEVLFGVAGFEPLCRTKAVDVIMPDVKHCGGLQELVHIAAMADAHGVAVAPHNPSGPVATAASIQVCAGMRNFRILEMQWGEVNWRSRLVEPPERFVGGRITVPDRPGLGIRLNEAALGEALPI